jgi:hypothetical protein
LAYSLQFPIRARITAGIQTIDGNELGRTIMNQRTITFKIMPVAQNSQCPARRRSLIAVVATLFLAISLGSGLVLAQRCSDIATCDTVQRIVCWTLVAGGVTGTFLAGAGVRCGWLILLGLQPVWIAYALMTGQYGFMLGSVAYAGAQMNGYLREGGEIQPQ